MEPAATNKHKINHAVDKPDCELRLGFHVKNGNANKSNGRAL